MSIEEILADVKTEGADPFADMEKETPSDSPAEKEPVKEEPTEGENTPEDNLPFHKHPRWIERESELKSLKEKDAATAAELAELKAFKEETSKKFSALEPTSTKIPDWFVKLYGENHEAYVAWEANEKERWDQKEREIEERILQKPEFQTMKATAEASRWSKWVEDELGKLTADGLEFDRNELINTMLEYRPTDEANNFDFKKGYALYKKLHSVEPSLLQSQARKQLADTTTRSSSPSKSPKDYMTATQLRNTSWNSL